jgi:hypothetical protein
MPQLLIETSKPTAFLMAEARQAAGSGKLVARGEFGRVGVPTQNGRRYSEALMGREIKRLTEDLKTRRVLGELDHPCLTSDDFRVLTADGWKEFRDVRVGDRVWSRKDGDAVLSEVTGITDHPYDGPAYRVRGRSMDATYTPAHCFLLVKRPDRNGAKTEEFVTLAEIAAQPERYAHHAVPKTATFFAEEMPQVTIPGVQAKRLASCKNDVSQSLVLDAGLFAAFLGIYLAEGHCSADSTDNYDVCITQKTPWSKQFIYNEVLSKFPVGLEWREIDGGYALADQRLYAYLKPLGDAYEKRVPVEAKALDVESLRELLFWFCIGDGRMVASGAAKRAEMTPDGQTTKEAMAEAIRGGTIPFTRQDAFSVSHGLVCDLHECLVRAGGAGSIIRIDPAQDYEYAGRTIRAEDKVPLYQLHICQSENVWMDPRHLAIEEVRHMGNIYCLSTTHGSFYMERDGHAWWTGNSDGKTSLKRVSHVITDLWIEKDGRVMGEAEILNTPEGKTLKALIEANIPIGVSSRGFGSTKPAADEEAEDVQDDFSLKTYDFVADPAVRTAIPNITTESVDEPTAAQMFLSEFPDVATQIQEAAAQDALTKAKDKVTAGLDAAVAEAERRVRSEMTEAFERRLAQALIEAREDIGTQLREEYAIDPSVGGARATLAAIAEMVGAYRQSPDEAAVRDALRAKDIEVAERTKERDEAVEEGTQAAIMLRVERQIGSHPMAEMIRELLRGTRMESVEDADSKLAVVMEHLPAPSVDVTPDGPTEQEMELREENATLRGDMRLLQAKADSLDEKLRRVVELTKRADASLAEADERAEKAEAMLVEAQERADRAELDAYKAKKVAGLVNSSSVMGLLEDVASRADVDKVVARHGSMEISDPELREMRRKLQRGQGDERDLTEDRAPQANVVRGADDFGNSFDLMRRLAGYNS